MQKVEIYTTGYCPYCHRAKALLQAKGVEYSEFTIDKNPELRPTMIERAQGRRTVPQIFIGDVHVGGCDELFALESSDKLNALLQS